MFKIRLFVFFLLVTLFVTQQNAFAQLANGQIPLAGTAIPKYVEALPTFVGARVDASGGNLTISMKEISQQVLPVADPPLVPVGYPKTKVWGYEINNGTTTFPAHYPAFTIEAWKNTPVTVTYFNKLGDATLYTPVSSTLPGILPVDQTLHWADPLSNGHMMTTYAGPVPTVPHLHGGEVQSTSDGGPDAWFTPDNHPIYPQITGPAWNSGVTNVYQYPNTQEAATIWYHDHALGATRLNVYAGLAGFYLLRDNQDNGLISNPIGLPAGNYEIEVAIQDKMFDTQGQLYFPNLGINVMDHPFWIPEFFGDVIVVNGKTWPYLQVEPRRYRFRLLDGSNARFYELFIMNLVNGTKGPSIWQIGTDGGLLDIPVLIDQNTPAAALKKLLMAPGERFDVIIDFAGFAGQTLTLMNSGKAPYPNGKPANPKTVGQIMQFRVGTTVTGGVDNSYNPATRAPLRTPLVKLVNFATGTPAVAKDYTRQLTLKEIMGMAGPLEVLVNNAKWMAPTTEIPTEGNTEVWQIINLTADAHPMHLHLTQFQLVSRQPFDITGYTKQYNLSFPGGVSPVDGLTYPAGVFIPGFGPPLAYGTAGVTPILGGNPDVTPFLKGKPRPADANEQGWKDTYKMYPGEVTTVIVRFAPTEKPAASAKSNLFFGFDPSVGPGYVWHCHIVDHEDNEMMRPYAVNPNPLAPARAKTVPGSIAETVTPGKFELEEAYPDPFNPSTNIGFQLPKDSRVVIRIFNSLGQQVQTLVNNDYSAGVHSVTWNAENLPSGMYYYQMQAGTFQNSKKIMLLK